MELWEAILLGIVEGITEFLPVSSTGHLTVTETLLGIQVDDVAVTAYTAIIKVGRDRGRDHLLLARHRGGWSSRSSAGCSTPRPRQTNDWRLSLAVIVGSLPIGSSACWPSPSSRVRCATCGRS
jgi:undecaprenyl-diphosphatase